MTLYQIHGDPGICQHGPELHSNTAFFMAPYRAIEFAIGALLVWAGKRQKSHKNWAYEILLLIGILITFYSIITFKESTKFPGLNALIPCVGAALIIYAGQARYLGVLLRNKISVGIGLISYSVYLAHWPAVVFYQYYKFYPLD